MDILPAAAGPVGAPAAPPPADPEPASGLRFTVLGPLEIHDGLRIRTPRAHKLRVLLALLLVRCNTVVSTDTLISELWGDRPPRTALKALRVYVSQLRRTLAVLPPHDERPVIVTRDPGYRLEIDDGTLDLIRFERLCELGRMAADEGDLERALRHYRAATGLWRGPALVDVRSSSVLEGVALSLEEARISALERRIRLQIRLGGHIEVIGDLRALAAEHPLHERVHAQLMVALYLAGRRADALAAFRALREACVNDLGVEPSHDLQVLHRSILESDAASPRHWEAWIA
ncbi:AfsR/SARP family transcriptional regulator [Actinomadura chokoriensis]|uniref:AfsR/SARP family transcriptional regulator n=1 Tax=Actinomadura chokoriensis TaxID=454156 RepID=UPI0031F8057E